MSTDNPLMWSTPDAGYDWVIEENAREIAKNEFRPNDVILDIGAHVGTYGIQALAAGAGMCVFVEPVPRNLKHLYRNISRFGVESRSVVLPYLCAVEESRPVTAEIYACNGNSGQYSMLYKPGIRQETITCQTIDLQKLVYIFSPNILKMDIEGAEWEFLAYGAFYVYRMLDISLHALDNSVFFDSEMAAKMLIPKVNKNLQASGWPEILTTQGRYCHNR